MYVCMSAGGEKLSVRKVLLTQLVFISFTVH